MRLVLCAFVVTLFATLTLAGCADDDYKTSIVEDGSATNDGGTD